MKDSKGKITFAMPEGMTIPEGKEKGDTFEVPAVLRVEDDGKLCLVSVSGMKLKGYEDKEDVTDEEEDAFMSGLQGEYRAQKG